MCVLYGIKLYLNKAVAKNILKTTNKQIKKEVLPGVERAHERGDWAFWVEPSYLIMPEWGSFSLNFSHERQTIDPPLSA